MGQKKLIREYKSLEGFRLPEYKEIPDVGLYLEQTTKFIMDYLDPLPDVSITGSMISNYVKKDIIANPVKKQYYRDQICELIFIAVAKSVLPLEDIQTMLEIHRQTYSTEYAYTYFCSKFVTILDKVLKQEALPPLNIENAPKEKILLYNLIITASHRIYLNQYFAKLEQEGK